MRATHLIGVACAIALTACGSPPRRSRLAPSGADATPTVVRPPGVPPVVVDAGRADAGDAAADAAADDVVRGPTDAVEDAAAGDVTPTDAAPEVDVPPPSEPVFGGAVVLDISSVEPPYQGATVTAHFYHGAAAAPPVVATDGPCQAVQTDGTPWVDPTPGLDAGALTFTGLTQPLTLVPQDRGALGWRYEGVLPEGTVLLGAAPTVVLSAEGGPNVPSFSVSAPVPPPVQVASPVPGGPGG